MIIVLIFIKARENEELPFLRLLLLFKQQKDEEEDGGQQRLKAEAKQKEMTRKKRISFIGLIK